MNKALLLVVAALLVFYPSQSFAQDLNPWGSTFDCGVDWFSQCKAVRENQTEEPTKLPATAGNTSSLSGTSTAANLPPPVRNVLENPSPETARAYVLWSKQASERLAKASEYIAQATREINSEASTVRNSNERSNDLSLAGVGPVGLYYFFSPSDPSAANDVAVLNKIWREARIGVVGIPVRGNDEEVVNYVNETKPLFPIRKSNAEVRMLRPTETPDLYLAMPLQRRIFRLGSYTNEATLKDALTKALTEILGIKEFPVGANTSREKGAWFPELSRPPVTIP
jgi:hypothetical protein